MMIASISGITLTTLTDSVIIDVGGIGIRVYCSPDLAQEVIPGEPVCLSTTLVVREDSLTLYGFPDDADRDMFETVQTVSGVGPRVALTLLTTMPAHAVALAVHSEDIAALTAVPGIGKKGAQRLIMDLTEKIPTPTQICDPLNAPELDWKHQVQSALISLGWTVRDADRAIELAAQSDSATNEVPVSVPDMLKTALQLMGAGKPR